MPLGARLTLRGPVRSVLTGVYLASCEQVGPSLRPHPRAMLHQCDAREASVGRMVGVLYWPGTIGKTVLRHIDGPRCSLVQVKAIQLRERGPETHTGSTSSS